MANADSSKFEDLVELGTEIAGALDSSDVLGRWMAHYIADLIKRAETADGPVRDSLQRECATEILNLWDRRQNFRNSDRPMASLEPILRALTRLDPESPSWSFYQNFNIEAAPTSDQVVSNSMLQVALEVENSARDLVRDLIVRAADLAGEVEGKWIELARRAGTEPDYVRVLSRLRHSTADDLESGDDAADGHTIRALVRLSRACDAARNALIARNSANLTDSAVDPERAGVDPLSDSPELTN